MLHTDVQDVGGITNDAPKEARGGGHGNEGREGGFLIGC